MGTGVGVVDYGVGNLGSVLRALDEVGAAPRLLLQPADLVAAERVLLPGVGSFTDCKRRLDDGGWTDALHRHAGSGRPLLGICVGMQLLASHGDEGSDGGARTPGLGLVPGRVRALADLGCTGRIPHVGWNSVNARRDAPLLARLPAGTDFYFVHSYAFVPDDPADLLATAEYGLPVAAAVQRGAVLGVQFHPEKSGRAGFQVLRNFVQMPLC
jgi:glutamine amidotransferase